MNSHNRVCMPHIVSVDELTDESANALIERALEFKHGDSFCFLEQKFVVNVFLEHSTQTLLSFEMAEKRLGLSVLDFDAKMSALAKGQSLEDLILSLDALGADAIVMRAPHSDFFQTVTQTLPLRAALINAGDGTGQHPSQSLLDAMTIVEKFGRVKGLRVGILGDIAHSRVANSDMRLLKRLGAKLFFAGPNITELPYLDQFGRRVTVDELVQVVDVLIVLRVQLERLDADERQSFSAADYFRQYGLTEARAAQLRRNAIIMHPTPFNREIDIAGSLVTSPRSKIFEQLKNGVFMRMAMLESVLRR